MIYLYFFMVLFLLLIISIKFTLIYLYLSFVLGNILLLLLVLSIKRSEDILVKFCIRKNIHNYVISGNRIIKIVYNLIYILLIIYICSILSRLFVIINNIFVNFSLQTLEIKYMSLFSIVIILILLISTILCWIDLMNKKQETGKYNKINIIIAIFLTFLLFLSIILYLIPPNVNNIIVLIIIGLINFTWEIISIIINGDIILFNLWEKSITIPPFNISKISLKFNELKNYINLTLLKINVIIENINEKKFQGNKNFIEKKDNSYLNYRKFSCKNKNGNLIIRVLRFIIDVFLIIKWKMQIYELQYLFLSRLKYYGSFASYSGSKLAIGSPSQLSIIEPHRNIIETGTINEDSFTRKRDYSIYLKDNLNISDEEDNVAENQNKKIKIGQLWLNGVFLNEDPGTLQLSKTDSLIYYPGYGTLTLRDISEKVLKVSKNKDVHNYIVKYRNTYNVLYKFNNDLNSCQLTDLVSLTYQEQSFLKNKDIANILNKHLFLYNNSLVSKFTIINYINMYQIQALTEALGDLAVIPAKIDLLSWNDKDAILGQYPQMRSVFFFNNDYGFVKGFTRIPNNNTLLCYKKIYEIMIKYNYILDYDLNCKSLIVLVNNKVSFNEKEFNDAYNIISINLKLIKADILENIKNLRRLDIIDEKTEKDYINHYNSLFDHFNYMLKNRYKVLCNVLVDKKLVHFYEPYLTDCLIQWKYSLSNEIIKNHDKIRTPDLTNLNVGLNISSNYKHELERKNFPYKIN